MKCTRTRPYSYPYVLCSMTYTSLRWVHVLLLCHPLNVYNYTPQSLQIFHYSIPPFEYNQCVPLKSMSQNRLCVFGNAKDLKLSIEPCVGRRINGMYAYTNQVRGIHILKVLLHNLFLCMCLYNSRCIQYNVQLQQHGLVQLNIRSEIKERLRLRMESMHMLRLFIYVDTQKIKVLT